MEARKTGTTHGNKGFVNTVTYLGTDADDTPSHSNPKKDAYFKAKADYARTGNRKNLLTMSDTSIYLKRDIDTFSNMKGRSKADFIRNERKLMKGTGRNVKSYEFVISPDPSKDHIDPNNPDNVARFQEYVQTWVHNCFNGDFMDTKTKSKSGYRKYKFKRDNNNYDRFFYFANIQPDSHDGSNVHCHVVIINRDLKTGNGLNRLFYGRNHIRQTTKRATEEFNKSNPDHPMTTVNPKRMDKTYQLRTPTTIVKPIIQGLNDELSNLRNTSRWKLILALDANYKVEAKHLRKTKHRKYGAWKFRYFGDNKNHSWISATRLSGYFGGSHLTAKGIDASLHNNLINYMAIKHDVKQAKQRYNHNSARTSLVHVRGTKSSASAQSSSTDSIPDSSSYQVTKDESYMVPHTMQTSVNANDSDRSSVASASVSQSVSLSASLSKSSYSLDLASHSKEISSEYASATLSYHGIINSIKDLYDPRHTYYLYPTNTRWLPLRNDFRNYKDISAPALTIGQALPKFSTDKVRKSSQSVYGSILQTTVVAKHRGIKEFRIISNGLKYTDNDVSLFHQVLDPLINGFRSESDKLRKWAYINWRKGKRAIVNYFDKHGWTNKLVGYKTRYKNVFERDVDGIMNNNEWVKEPDGQIPIHKYTSHPFKSKDLLTNELQYHKHKSKIHFAYNNRVDKYNTLIDKKRKLVQSVDTLPKSISDRFSSIVAPVMQTFNSKSSAASSASSASASNSRAMSATLSGNSATSAYEYSQANDRLNQIRESIKSSGEAWSSAYYWSHDPIASYANNASNYDSALAHLDKLEKSTKSNVKGLSDNQQFKATEKYIAPRERLESRSASSVEHSEAAKRSEFLKSSWSTLNGRFNNSTKSQGISHDDGRGFDR